MRNLERCVLVDDRARAPHWPFWDARHGLFTEFVQLVCPEDVGDTAEIEMVGAQSVHVVGACALNHPGEFELVSAKNRHRMLTLSGDTSDHSKFTEPGFVEVRHWSQPMEILMASPFDVAIFNVFPDICPLEWGMSTPLVSESLVVTVRRLVPNKPLVFGLFGRSFSEGRR